LWGIKWILGKKKIPASSQKVINKYYNEFINEPIKDVQKVLSETLSRINKLVEIKDKVKEIEEQLNNLKIKYGEKTEISKEMLSDQNEPLKVNNNNKMKFASQRNSETEVNRNE